MFDGIPRPKSNVGCHFFHPILRWNIFNKSIHCIIEAKRCNVSCYSQLHWAWDFLNIKAYFGAFNVGSAKKYSTVRIQDMVWNGTLCLLPMMHNQGGTNRWNGICLCENTKKKKKMTQIISQSLRLRQSLAWLSTRIENCLCIFCYKNNELTSWR